MRVGKPLNADQSQKVKRVIIEQEPLFQATLWAVLQHHFHDVQPYPSGSIHGGFIICGHNTDVLWRQCLSDDHVVSEVATELFKQFLNILGTLLSTPRFYQKHPLAILTAGAKINRMPISVFRLGVIEYTSDMTLLGLAK